MNPVKETFHRLGEGALLLTLSEEVSPETNKRVLRISRDVERAKVPGIGEAQPTYSSLCVHFDPSRVRESWVREFVSSVCRSADGDARDEGRHIDIPVVYGGDEGPDLESSARELGMSPQELVERHSSRSYRVYMVGFTPGFPYLGGMDEAIALPRLTQPRAKVPPGSVGIGGSQTGVYPWETPGGWRLLGRTHLSMFSPDRDDPSLLHPGDTVRFVPVGRDEVPEANGTPPPPAPVQLSSLSAYALEIEHPGFFMIVVDEGRFGYRKMGVPVSGAADLRSYRRANLLAGNPGGQAALEMTLLGAKVRARIDCLVAFAGAQASLHLDGAEVPMDSPLRMAAGSLLEVGPFTAGCRGYLAILGGIDVPEVLGSRSTYVRGRFGGFQGRPVKTGDVLPVGPAPEAWRALDRIATSAGSGCIPPSITAELSAPWLTLRVMDGPEGEPGLVDALCSGEFTVNPESDRMGLRLTGPAVPVGKGDILSSAVIPGVIEVPADGRPLLLLSDCQTTGGYRRIATVKECDLPLAGHLRPGAKARFTRAT